MLARAAKGAVRDVVKKVGAVSAVVVRAKMPAAPRQSLQVSPPFGLCFAMRM